MADKTENQSDITSVSAQVTEEFVEEFDLSLKKAQIEGEVPMNVSRSQVIRGLMKLAIEDTQLIANAVEEDEQ